MANPGMINNNLRDDLLNISIINIHLETLREILKDTDICYKMAKYEYNGKFVYVSFTGDIPQKFIIELATRKIDFKVANYLQNQNRMHDEEPFYKQTVIF